MSLKACDICVILISLFSSHSLKTFPTFTSHLTNMKNTSIHVAYNHVLILFKYFKTVSRERCAWFETTEQPSEDPPKRQATPLARIFNLPVTRRVKYSSSKTETFPYLVFQGIDETGSITDTRRHTYDPITFRMQITPSNHELSSKDIQLFHLFFDPFRPCVCTFCIPWHHLPHSSLSVRARLFLSYSTISVTIGINREREMRIADFFPKFSCGCAPRERERERENRGKIAHRWEKERRSVFACKWTWIGALCENEKVTKAEGKSVHIYA